MSQYTMKTAANALQRKGVNICKDYFKLSQKDMESVREIMSKTRSFRPNKNSGKRKERDFFERMSKYGSCGL